MLPDLDSLETALGYLSVSMHLMVLGASRPEEAGSSLTLKWRLNAPDGAGCFPTEGDDGVVERRLDGLNAPDGAGCFPTS